MSFDDSRLPKEFPRKFLSANLNAADPGQLGQVFDELEKQDLVSPTALEGWLWKESELGAALAQEQALRYVRMTCQTDDSQREKDWLDFIENIEPLAKIRFADLDRKYLDAPGRKGLPAERFGVLDRRRSNSLALFRRENVELEKDEAKLSQQFQKVAGAMTVMYEGEERTMQQLARFLEEPVRKVREETWLLEQNRRFQDRGALNDIFDQMIGIRQKIAENAGYDNYRDYMFRKKERFDYTPEDCFQYHSAVEKYVVPLLRELDQQRGQVLKLDPLRPWDLAVDPEGRAPLHPFSSATELVEGCARIFDKVNPPYGKNLRRLAGLGLLDLESRKGKAPGGYQTELTEVRLPFIFMNSVGRDQDVRTLLHESGHAFHTFAVREKNLLFHYRADGIPLEFAEVASQTMEIIGGEHLEGAFYSQNDAFRSRREHTTLLVRLLAWIATIDAFQHWVYTHPGHSREDREEFWLGLRKRFGSVENWEGYDNFRRSMWQRQLHLFEVPFYYIEYGIAWTGALGLWARYRKEPGRAIQDYENALGLGGSKPLPDLFGAAGLPFDFGPDTIGPYASEMRESLFND